MRKKKKKINCNLALAKATARAIRRAIHMAKVYRNRVPSTYHGFEEGGNTFS